MFGTHFWFNFWYSFFATVCGGVILTLCFFLLREKIFRLPEISGCWHFKMHTKFTSYNDYKEMKLYYVAMLWREGSNIHGTVEKIREDSIKKKGPYDGENRTRGIVSGYVEKKYFFSRDRIFLHVVEDGHGRESTHYYELKFFPKGKMKGQMKGSFNSMVADQSGHTHWKRDKF